MASRELKVEIIGDASSLERAFGRASKSGGGLGRTLTTLGKVAAVGVGAAFVGLGIVVKKGFDELAEGEQVAAQTAARLKSTGDAAHVTAKQVGELAVAQSKLTGIDDEAIQAGENMLLTFTNIRNEVGKNNDIFNQATVAVEDMATAMNDGAIPSGEQLSTTAIRIGKALNDPIKGMAALSRVGVAFTAGQKTQIEAMVKAGDTMGAQKLILAELTKEFGGSAKAAGETFPGQLAKLRNAFDDASSKVAVVFLPALTKLLRFITDRLIPGMGKAADFVRDFWQGISKRFANAPDFKAKIRVVFLGVADLARKFIDALFSQISDLLPQKPVVLDPRTKVVLAGGGVDWEAVADDMVAALALALEQSAALAKALAELVRKSIDQVDWPDLGKSMGPGFATMLAVALTTILDPAFWVKNWELTLSIALVVFGGAIGAWAAKIGARLSAALLGSVAKISPEFAAALGRLMDDAGKVALAVFDRVGTSLLKLATAVFGRLTKAAVFVIKVLGVQAAISAINDFVRAAIGKFKELLDWLSRLPSRITAALGNLGSILYDAGLAIIQGLWDGMRSKLESMLGWVGSIGGKIKALKGPPAQDKMLLTEIGVLIMQGLEDGMREGWGKIERMLEGLSPQLKEKVGGLVNAMQEAITAKHGVFASAFDSLVSAALAAFDRVSQEFETRTEAKIRKQDEQRASRDRQQALQEAKEQLADARRAAGAVSGTRDEFGLIQVDPQKAAEAVEAVKRAQQAVADAQFAIQRARDEREAAQERTQYEQKRERQRVFLENQLARLQNAYANQELSAEQFHNKLLAIFKKFEIPLGKAANKLGFAIAAGLRESMAEAQKAARDLAQAVINALSNIRVVVQVDIRGKEPDKRQHGGPVRRGRPYIVGEAGPELFIPSAAGSIATASEAARMAGGATIVEVNVYGDVTGEEIVRKVREGLLRVDLYNPGSAIARS